MDGKDLAMIIAFVSAVALLSQGFLNHQTVSKLEQDNKTLQTQLNSFREGVLSVK